METTVFYIPFSADLHLQGFSKPTEKVVVIAGLIIQGGYEILKWRDLTK
jgi:hypothetical protein